MTTPSDDLDLLRQIDMPETPVDLMPGVVYTDPERSLQMLIHDVADGTVSPRQALDSLKTHFHIEMPYLIPGLGVYRVQIPMAGGPPARHAALRFVAQVQDDPAADGFAQELPELAECHFELEEETGIRPDGPVGSSRMRLRVVRGES